MKTIQHDLKNLVEIYLNLVKVDFFSNDEFKAYDKTTIMDCIHQDLSRFTIPYLYTDKPGNVKLDKSESLILSNILHYRAKNIAKYLKNVDKSITHLKNEHEAFPIEISPLDGDSHCGGERPILVKTRRGKYVVKHTDPRPYYILSQLVKAIERKISIGLEYPSLELENSSNEWQILPFINNESTHSFTEESHFMRRVGSLVAIAYYLDLTDLHLENIIAYRGVPVIIDAECMFSAFHSRNRTAKERLLLTGLVASEAHLSGISGGITPSNEIGLHLHNGKVSYLKSKITLSHRLRTNDGQCSDPIHHLNSIKRGFKETLITISSNRKYFSSLLHEVTNQECSTRYVYRPTAHYKCHLELMLSPASIDKVLVYRTLFKSLFELAPLDPSPDIDLRTGEIHDLLNGDIPYFYLMDETPYVIHHQAGKMSNRSPRFKLSNRIKRAVDDFCPNDFDVLTDTLCQFITTEKVAP